MVKIVNLTPHPLTLVRGNGEKVVVEPSGQVARVATTREPAGEIAGIPVVRVGYGEVENLPEPQEGTIYIVSSLVLNALREAGVERADIFAPDTSPAGAVRDEEGRIVGVRALVRL